MPRSGAVLTQPRRAEVPASDVQSGSEDEVGLGIVQSLRVKGFCVVRDGFSAEALDEARRDADSLAAAGRLRRPAPLVQDGLLGFEGSRRIVELTKTDFADVAQAPEGEGLRDCDLFLWMLAKALEPHQESIGLRCTSRSAAVLHRVGCSAADDLAGEEGEEVDLSDHDASHWLSIFVRQKVLLLLFLGPDGGVVQLNPYEDDARPMEFAFEPGMAVLVRTDLLQSRCEATGDACALSCSLLQDDVLRMEKSLRARHMTPAASALEFWVNNRIRDLKAAEDEETSWDKLDVPRAFVLAMNHNYYKRQQVAVRGICARLPSTWDVDQFCLAQISGPDLAVEVPLSRWDHSTVYDPAPDCWLQDPPRTNCKHGCFMEGIELFDHKMFGLSPNEVKGMDPCQRLTLEVAYEALYRSGERKKTLMNSTCGVYVGTAVSEWNYAERSLDVGIFGATGGAPSITAGRISFSLGLKGACIAIDTEASSSLTATYWAADSVELKGNGRVQHLACAIGVHLMLAKTWWPAHSAAGFLSPTGRCQTFDAAGSGYIRGDGCAALVLKPLKDEDDTASGSPLIGTICGGASNNNGRSAGLTAPHGPAEQQVISEAYRGAGIAALDVDAVECHGSGSLLADAVEAGSCSQVLRGAASKEPLVLSALKTSAGNSIEAAGATAVIKALLSMKFGCVPGNLHLRSLNPHIDEQESPLLISGECLQYRMRCAFTGVSARGFGGTNVHVLCHGGREASHEEGAALDDAEASRPRLCFWPNGGGGLDNAARPRKGYFLVTAGAEGAWPETAEEPMDDEGNGCYGYTVTLGEDRCARFRLLLDADGSRVLHPRQAGAPSGTAVFGPSRGADIEGSFWLIDART
eukprot:TRINITY_DN22332_c0_g1_i2.p1 TRINITY_DN22332_c0_g1~~TRINITY_DN22332_c0_g1_i2.p1  ORF type:complete len:863 (+),score=187.93 TRINITY_DN22332_c0_g1_i2:54-2642(+)